MEAAVDVFEAKLNKMEAIREKSKAVAVHQEVANEEETIGALEDRYEDRPAAILHRRQPKKRTQGDGVSMKNLTATRRLMAFHAFPTPR
jgi:hypothetical protein